ncbi:ABC transporter permease [Streptomyces sp. NBC_01803]|uniref:ABC transporter permease n=1 Tax=Streptomyces sp. NBC_01803 TaxID=2975946 RepID=UPI002DD88166|nr:ABC transporter permease [Streptomyces sp. NBC_01803]WSA45594.1 ABC transporter permease [Streptomyces sp. NBC_01803]
MPSSRRMTAHALPHSVTDALTMTRRGFAHWARRPGRFAVGLAFPVMMLVVFALFLGGGMAVEGGGDYTEFLVPGMLTLTMAFGLEGTMIELAQDINRGILDRFRSMPISPSSILVGRSLLDMLSSAVSLLIMTGAGLAIGWRWHGTAAGAAAALGLLLLLRFAMLWAGIYLALVAGKPDLVQAVQILVWPVAFLSNAFTSPGTMPGWMGAIADWNPMSATAGAVRELFANPGWTTDSWAAGHTVALAVAWPLLLLAVFVPLAVGRYARLSD